MKTYDGEKYDLTNFKTDKYLKVNSCGFQNAPKNYTVIRKRGRLDYHLLLIISGNCEALHCGENHTLTAGNIIIYSPNEEQKYSFPSKSTTLWCHFTGTVADEIITDAKLKSGVYSLKPKNEILASFSELVKEFHTQGRESFANARLVELIYNISNACNSPADIRGYDIIAPALAYLNENYNKEISLDSLAEITGYSKSRFSHLFSEVTGTTAKKYQNELRLKTSCEMLTSTKYTIGEISEICGFSDPLYYSRIFKKKYGVSPSEYRN